MRILITGATGLIGQEIVNQCHKKDIDVNYLTTSKAKISTVKNYQGYYWNPKKNEIDTNCFDGVETIIHLAGASISKRWTKAYKKEIIFSRVKTTELLINSLKDIQHQVRHVISSSAIGIYPDSQTNYYDENFEEVGDSFLSLVVQKWEAAVDGFLNLKIKVSKIRTGLVLSNKGGALPQIVKPIKFGLGASFGTGKQWQSWIHIKDLGRLFLFVTKNELEGVFNGVSPDTISNHEFTKIAAHVIDSPLFMPNIPKSVMKFVLGDMFILLFLSQRVSSKKIEDKGFQFRFHHLKPALEDLLIK
ncbi:NAD-dependent epimerase [Pseudalgibacter alginicilyticus]|uniref:NAD-dependent epimerase n=1 Tax=Pseudalgibacter alginicilyticus TaxID=1736674 RepID=A0A0P0CNP8_9FLAO|nr:TIGR01777 family oxidoreductase [Pseudalgibacter alginicilyticus]ALJ04432.1 NAD-dependent epimerase [Pseudalgibacter alginicilyticus]